MKNYLFFILFLISFSFAKPIEYVSIDRNKSIIQLAVVKYVKSLDYLKSFEKENETYLEKRDGRYIYYLVNIEKKDKSSMLSTVRQKVKHAFFISYSHLQSKSTPFKQNTHIQDSLILMQTKINSIPYSQIDNKKSVIQIAVVRDLNSLDTLAYYSKIYDTYIEKRGEVYIYYVVNVKNNDKKEVLSNIKKRVRSAFFLSSSMIKPIQTQFNLETLKNNKLTKNKEKIEGKSQNVIHTLAYKEALNLYKQKMYLESYERFNQLFFDNMGNTLVNYYLGRSAYETGQYEFAISAYDRILIAEPLNTRVRLELAQTYLQMELYSQALKEFNLTLEDVKIPSKVKEKVLANINLIKTKQTKHFFNITTLLGVIYDSNINNSPEAGDFDIYNPTLNSNVTLSNSGEKESTIVYQLASIFNHKYKVDDSFVFDNSLTAMALKYDDFKEKDIHYLSLSTKPTFVRKDYKIDVAFTFDKVYLGHKGYQKNFYISPSYTKILSSKFLLTTGLKFGQVNYDIEDTKSANIVGWQNSLKYATKGYGLFTFGANIGKEIEQKETRTDVSHYYYEMTIGNTYNFDKDYSLLTSAGYKVSKYKDEDVNFLSKKENKKQDYGLTFQKKIDQSSVVNLGGTYTKQDSNHESSPYSKHTFKINYLKNF